MFLFFINDYEDIDETINHQSIKKYTSMKINILSTKKELTTFSSNNEQIDSQIYVMFLS
jgi:molybdopterin biosynthesis enzyme